MLCRLRPVVVRGHVEPRADILHPTRRVPPVLREEHHQDVRTGRGWGLGVPPRNLGRHQRGGEGITKRYQIVEVQYNYTLMPGLLVEREWRVYKSQKRDLAPGRQVLRAISHGWKIVKYQSIRTFNSCTAIIALQKYVPH